MYKALFVKIRRRIFPLVSDTTRSWSYSSEMSGPTAKFLMELLEDEEHAIEAIELQMASDSDLIADQRTNLLDLQTTYENLCDKLKAAIAEHDFTEELPEWSALPFYK